MTMDARQRDIIKIHVARRELALDDNTYRALLNRVTGKDSAKTLTAPERAQVLREFERLGWKPKKARRKPKAEDWRTPRIRLIFRLWYWLYDNGATKSRTPESLLKFCQQHIDAEKLEWATSKELNDCVEALKSWQARTQKEASQ